MNIGYVLDTHIRQIYPKNIVWSEITKRKHIIEHTTHILICSDIRMDESDFGYMFYSFNKVNSDFLFYRKNCVIKRMASSISILKGIL